MEIGFLVIIAGQDRRHPGLDLRPAVGPGAEAVVDEGRRHPGRLRRSSSWPFRLRFGGSFQIFNSFDQGLLFQACAMTMVALGLNLIYGFNGQFSLAQWGFYGIGAYCAADITYRWINGDARGLIVVGRRHGPGRAGPDPDQPRCCKRIRGIPVLSAFTLYLLASAAARAGGRVRRPPAQSAARPAAGHPGRTRVRSTPAWCGRSSSSWR